LTSFQNTGFGQTSAFHALGLLASIVRATDEERYTEPTPVQKAVVPHVIAGRDILACAQTGTGKTAAFVLPILHQLANSDGPRDVIAGLVLTPTRELAAQIAERIAAYGKYLGIRHAVVYGGVSQFRQEQALKQRPRLLVATPGRLLDLMEQGFVRVDRVTHFVLDEADRMLDMGFVNDVRRVVRELPKQRQTLLFSATVPKAIEALANSLLNDPVRVDVTPKVTAAETIEQSVVFVQKDQKSALLERVLTSEGVERAIVFTRTKHGANRLSERLERAGIGAPAIHGNKSQSARERALAGFKGGKTRVLVATDIAARGIDVDGISHVINFDLPNVPESYVHRVGRTGRAGARGRAISFCDRDEQEFLRDIERLLRQRIPVIELGSFGDLPPAPLRSEQRSDSRGEQQRGQFRGEQRGQSRGGFRGEQRGASRGASRSEPRVEFRGPPRGDVRGTPQGGSRSEPRVEFRGPPRGDVRGPSQGDSRGEPRRETRGPEQSAPRPGGFGDAAPQRPRSHDGRPQRWGSR
jgi:ATP-dependent RNA helicase RhlE